MPAVRGGRLMARRLEARCRSAMASARSSSRVSPASAPRKASISPSPRAATYSTYSTRLLGSGLRSLPNPRKEGVEHPATSSVAVVVAEHVLVQVGLQVLRRDPVVDPADPALHQRPEPLDGLYVNVPAYVDLLRVVHRAMRVQIVQLSEGLPFVGVDGRTRLDLRVDVRSQAFSRVRFDFRVDLPVPHDLLAIGGLGSALDDAEHRRLVGVVRTWRTGPLWTVPPHPTTTDVRRVHLDRSREQVGVLVEQRTDQLEHAPSGRVGDADLAFQLLRGNPASSASHEVHGLEPQTQRRGRTLEDRPLQRVLVVSAELAGVRGPVGQPVVLRDLPALRAEDPLRVQFAHEVVQTRRVVHELRVELHAREHGLRGSRSLRCVPAGLCHRKTKYDRSAYVCQLYSSHIRSNPTMGV